MYTCVEVQSESRPLDVSVGAARGKWRLCWGRPLRAAHARGLAPCESERLTHCMPDVATTNERPARAVSRVYQSDRLHIIALRYVVP